MAKDGSSLSKQYSRRLVAEVLLHRAPLSRAALARATGLSKQTISIVIAELEAEGWVRSVGISRGAIGRTAVSYDLAQDAALSIGVDLGGTKVSLAIADLLGKTIGEITEPPTDAAGPMFYVRFTRSLSGLPHGKASTSRARVASWWECPASSIPRRAPSRSCPTYGTCRPSTPPGCLPTCSASRSSSKTT